MLIRSLLTHLIRMKKDTYLLIGIAVIAVLLIAAGSWYMSTTQSLSLNSIISSTAPGPTSTASNPSPAAEPPMPPTPAPHPTPSPTPSSAAPRITNFEPVSGIVGSTITIIGSGFDRTTNYIYFGTSGGRHHPDGSPDNQIAISASPNGKSVTFVVPSAGPSGILCDVTNHCVGISAVRIIPGNYPVTVRTSNGMSAPATFTVTQ